jgi:hypothetical protein
VEGDHTGERLGRFPFQAGELVLADAGYINPPGVAAVVRQGADVIVRLNRWSLPLMDEKNRLFPLWKKGEELAAGWSNRRVVGLGSVRGPADRGAPVRHPEK